MGYRELDIGQHSFSAWGVGLIVSGMPLLKGTLSENTSANMMSAGFLWMFYEYLCNRSFCFFFFFACFEYEFGLISSSAVMLIRSLSTKSRKSLVSDVTNTGLVHDVKDIGCRTQQWQRSRPCFCDSQLLNSTKAR